MANLLIVTEFAEMQITQGGRLSTLPMHPAVVTCYTVATATVSATSFNANTSILRLHAKTGAMCYTITTAGTIAAATDTRLALNQTEYVGVPKGQGYRISAVDIA
jgi:hypothetical protein